LAGGACEPGTLSECVFHMCVIFKCLISNYLRDDIFVGSKSRSSAMAFVGPEIFFLPRTLTLNCK
jgi:hypothetical protein